MPGAGGQEGSSCLSDLSPHRSLRVSCKARWLEPNSAAWTLTVAVATTASPFCPTRGRKLGLYNTALSWVQDAGRGSSRLSGPPGPTAVRLSFVSLQRAHLPPRRQPSYLTWDDSILGD